MKIIFLNIYQDLVDRGAETFVFEVAKRLSVNHKVTVIEGGNLPQPYQVVTVNNIQAYPTDRPDFFWRILHKFYLDGHSRQVFTFTKKTIPHIVESQPDWVIPLNGFWQLWQLRRLQSNQRFKILVSGQAGTGKDDYWNLKLGPDIFVALTNYAADWAKKIASRTDIVTIPNGVDLNKFSPKTKPVEINLPRPLVLCVGALVSYKRVDLTIKAVSKLDQAGLVILGSGPEEKNLRQLATKLLGNRFLITTVNSEQMPAYYAAADLFTLASQESEAFGIAYLEAMASSKAVVAPADLAKKEIIGKAGLFFDPNSIDDYTDALKKALVTDWHDLPRHQAGKFDWDEIAQNYEQLMLSL